MAARITKTDNSTALGEYLGTEVTETVAKITNTGDGLSAAMELDPVVFRPGDLVTFAVRCRVVAHNHLITEDGEEMKLVQVFKAGTIAPIDDDLVGDIMNTMQARVEARNNTLSGKLSLPGMDESTGRKARQRSAAKENINTLTAVPDPAK
jgi:hypothetical protein